MFLSDGYLAPVMQSLSAISERQKMTSANIANAHTPGYTAKSASFSDLLQASNPFETDLSQKLGSRVAEVNYNSGTPVDLQKELIEMHKNFLFYSMVTRRASSIFTGLKAAAQAGR
jgi:flagellar basal body rod protein FlgB